MRAIVVLSIGAVGILTLALSRRRKTVTATRARTSLAVHEQATGLAREAFESVIHEAPTRNELRILLAVGLHETTFGQGWHEEGADSNNMGAIQANQSWTGETFGGIDTHPTETGGTVSYQQAFRKYPSPLEGWKDLVRVLYVQMGAVRSAARTGDPFVVAKEMREAKYYEGQGATQAQRIGNYEQALVNALWEIDKYGQVK